MKILEFPSVKNHPTDIEDLWQKIVDDTFDKWREEFEIQNGTKIDDVSYLAITSNIWDEVSNLILGIVGDDFYWESEWYVLSMVKQKVKCYRDRVMLTLQEWEKKEEKDVKSNVVSLFGGG